MRAGTICLQLQQAADHPAGTCSQHPTHKVMLQEERGRGRNHPKTLLVWHHEQQGQR